VEAPLSKDEVGAIAPGLAGEDGQGLRRQGQRELSPVLYPVRRQYDLLLCKINLLPLQPANLAAPTAGQQKQTNYLAEAIIAQTAPQLAKLILGQDPITAGSCVCRTSAGHGIGFCQPLLDCPREKGGERTAGAVANGRAGRSFDLPKQDSD